MSISYKQYKSVFGNIVIANIVFNFVKIYKKNRIVDIYGINSLKTHKEREFIQSLVYFGGTKSLEFGDLPIGCALKEVELNVDFTPGSVIPLGVEIVRFRCDGYNNETTLLSDLPSTVHSVYNVLLYLKPYEIPSNIKTISFLKCPNISTNINDCGNDFFSIPNTIRELKFSMDWENEKKELRPNDIPYGITKLEIYNIQFGKHVLPESLTILKTQIRVENFLQFQLPNSLKELELKFIGIIPIELDNELFKFIPNNLECLTISFHNNITVKSGLHKCNSIKKLNVKLYGQNGSNQRNVESNSLPPNLQSLTLSNSIIFEQNTLPKTLCNLEFILEDYFKVSQETMDKLISILPNSLNYLTLSKFLCGKFNINLPPNIKLIKKKVNW